MFIAEFITQIASMPLWAGQYCHHITTQNPHAIVWLVVADKHAQYFSGSLWASVDNGFLPHATVLPNTINTNDDAHFCNIDACLEASMAAEPNVLAPHIYIIEMSHFLHVLHACKQQKETQNQIATSVSASRALFIIHVANHYMGDVHFLSPLFSSIHYIDAVDQKKDSIEKGRDRYRFYQKIGYTLTHRSI